MTDVFGRAVADHYHGDRDEPLVARDGTETRAHPIEEFYFRPFRGETDRERWLTERLDAGPLLDLGAGAGRHALYFQDRTEAIAVEVSRPLVEVMRERGVDDARRGDMFDLGATVERDRFRSVLVVGTQFGLAGSMAGFRRLLRDVARVTAERATLVVDGYDPSRPGVEDLLGFRSDPTRGLASRVFHFEYGDEVGSALLFRLFSPGRLDEAAARTGWSITEVYRPDDVDPYFRVALEKR